MTNDIQIFSDEEEDLKILDAKLDPITEEVEEEVPSPPKQERTKTGRKKRVLTEEQKERLRNQLKKGRETSLANRRKKSQLNKIEKEEKMTAQEEKLLSALQKKKSEKKDNKNLLDEIAELKEKLRQKEPQVFKDPVVAIKKITPVETKKKHIIEEEKIVNIPCLTPTPKMSNKQLLKMMKGMR